VSVLVYAVMAVVGIGLKVSTLPMVALGAGIGVDYGIYLFSRMQEFLRQGLPVKDAYERTFARDRSEHHLHGHHARHRRGNVVFSPLKFQADIGVMLTFMFLVTCSRRSSSTGSGDWLRRPVPHVQAVAAS